MRQYRDDWRNDSKNEPDNGLILENWSTCYRGFQSSSAFMATCHGAPVWKSALLETAEPATIRTNSSCCPNRDISIGSSRSTWSITPRPRYRRFLKKFLIVIIRMILFLTHSFFSKQYISDSESAICRCHAVTSKKHHLLIHAAVLCTVSGRWRHYFNLCCRSSV